MIIRINKPRYKFIFKVIRKLTITIKTQILFNQMATNTNVYPKVEIEYCKVCDYKGHCMELAQRVKENTPNASVVCKQGRRGSFEIIINDKLVYSKIQTMALPNYDEVVEVVNEVSSGVEPRKIIAEQPINCAIS